MKRSVEISASELVELIKDKLGITVPIQCVGLSASCLDLHDTGYGMLQLRSITLNWDEGKPASAWDRGGPGDR